MDRTLAWPRSLHVQGRSSRDRRSLHLAYAATGMDRM
jgi:hypothetical protein